MVRHQCDKNKRIHLFFGHNKFRKVHWTNSRQLFCFNWSVEARDYGFVQRDCATAHTRCNSMAVLQTVFWYRINCPHLWPVRSPGLTTCGEVWKETYIKAIQANRTNLNKSLGAQLRQFVDNFKRYLIIRSPVVKQVWELKQGISNTYSSMR